MSPTSTKTTPLPIKQVFLISMILFANIFGMMLIFPILPFMTHDFFPNLNKSQLGYKMGYLASAYHVGKFFGNSMWGKLADMYGRRPIMLCGLCGTILCIVLFGFSPNFIWACAARVLWGLLNANMAIATTYLSDILDDTNQASGFAWIGMSSGLGRLAAPVIGGFLSQPAMKYRWLDVPLFIQFPYLLVCLIGCVFSFTTLICAYFYLNETLIVSHTSLEKQNDILLTTENNNNSSSIMKKLKIFNPLLNIRWFILEMLKISKELTYRDTLLSILIYSLLAFITVQSQEIIPLFMVTDQKHGGYCMDSNEVGFLFLIGGIFQLLYQIFLFSKMIKWFNYRRSIRIFLLMLLIAIILLPCSHTITGAIPSTHSSVLKVLNTAPQLSDYTNYSLPSLTYINSTNLTNTNNNEIDTKNSEIDTKDSKIDEYALSNTEIETSQEISSKYYCQFSTDPGKEALNINSIHRIPGIFWVYFWFLIALLLIARAGILTASLVLVSNSSLPQNRGTVNGFSQSVASLMRMLAPTVGALLYAWSVNNGRNFPINYFLLFLLLSCIILLLYTISYGLSNKIEKKRTMTDINDNENNRNFT